ncbi:MAG: NAD(P)(+) transhydrogenase (Re/Si-specific) subunit beta [Planctomycetota bacterium]|jgi:NAD(P) transhydrogenase subunit beta
MEILYLVAATQFILGLKFLTGPRTARWGNFLSMGGMVLAILATFLLWEKDHSINWTVILIGAAAGTLIGLVSAVRVKMTAMPQMVALFNGFGGVASLLVAMFFYLQPETHSLTVLPLTAALVSAVIGGGAFSGSLLAFGKLQGIVTGRPILFRGQNLFNLVLLAGLVGLGIWAGTSSQAALPFLVLTGLSLVVGALMVIPIGGADMPVVISLLNSYSGVAVAMTGFVLGNEALIIVGSLIGASGFILTSVMCRAMNRSLLNVVFGGFGATAAAAAAGGAAQAPVKEASVEDAAGILGAAQSVIVVPGYGMAVAQAQHVVREIDALLQEKGAEVRYAIHPVAGRMPGHMNVLLAEANVPYEQLKDLDEINDEFKATDVVLVVGANDVVNPAAKTKPGSPIYGMPVLNAEEARAVIVLKRSMSPGFAGIDNEWFVHPRTMMVFGDARKTLTSMVGALKEQ